MFRTTRQLDELTQVVRELQHQIDLVKTVLVVKEPDSQLAAEVFEGLRKQVVAGAAERRAHVAQVVAMAVAVRRATSLQDLQDRIDEWLAGSGITAVETCEPGRFHHFFDDLDGGTLAGAEAIDVVEPAYVDTVPATPTLVRTGRAHRAAPRPAVAQRPAAVPPAAVPAGPNHDGTREGDQP